MDSGGLVLFIIHRQEESKGKRLARIFHEWLTPTTDMAVLPGVLGRRTLRRTVQVRLGSNPAVPRDGCPVALPSQWSRDSNS
jgi:hypothetical protein